MRRLLAALALAGVTGAFVTAAILWPVWTVLWLAAATATAVGLGHASST